MSVVASDEQLRELQEQVLDLKNQAFYWKQRALDLEIALLKAKEGPTGDTETAVEQWTPAALQRLLETHEVKGDFLVLKVKEDPGIASALEHQFWGRP